MMSAVELIRQRKETGKTVFVCGNGGSATTAEHFTNDLFARGVRAICLNSNLSLMTMIANDFGYEYVFQKQLTVYANRDDLLIVFSCSGKSANILKAIDVGLEVVRLFGNRGESPQEAENRHLIMAHEISERI